MWNQDWWKETDYDNDELDRFPKGAGFPAAKPTGAGANHARFIKRIRRAAVVLDTAPPRAAPATQHQQRKRRAQWLVSKT